MIENIPFEKEEACQFFTPTFSGMICHHQRTNQLDFGSNQVKGQGPGHEKVKNAFLS